MNDLSNATISTLEVAEMMEVEHWELLRKLDGRTKKDGTHTKGYVEILTDNQMVVSDFFIPSTYIDASGKENRCYNATRLGCDFLANKFTGEKGVVFTARYVKRFHEMEQVLRDGIGAEQGSIPIRFYKNGKWYILTIGEEVYSLKADEAKQISNAVSAMLKNDVPCVIEVVKSMIANLKREDCRLNAAIECVVKRSLPVERCAEQ